MANREEMLLAMRAVENGFISRDCIQNCLDLQKSLQSQGKSCDLSELLVEKHYLTPFHLRLLQSYQAVLEGSKHKGQQPIEGYQIIHKTAQGGMAAIFAAQWLRYNHPVGLKILLPRHSDNQRLVHSFLNEARLLSYLDCEHIIKGYQYGQSNALYFLAMEFINGISLQNFIDQHGALDISLALHVVIQIAKALQYLDNKGVVHRDVKPGNILIDRYGRVVLCDFGLAREICQKDVLEKKGLTCGTVAYISPEQARGEKEIDVRSDIYSLGITLYHLLAGELPFQGSPTEIIVQQVMSDPDKKARKRITSRIYPIIARMIAKERGKRHQKASEVIGDLENIRTRNKLDVNSYIKNKLAGFFSEHELPIDITVSYKLREYQRMGKFKRTVGMPHIQRDSQDSQSTGISGTSGVEKRR